MPQVFDEQIPDGDAQKLRQVADAREAVVYTTDRVCRLNDQGMPLSEIMVLYKSRKHAVVEELPLLSENALAECGILATWTTRDA